LKAIKLHPNSVQRCPVCGAKQCTLLKAPNGELSSGGPADKRQQTEQAARRLLK
jgi:hypothetical protein